PGVSVDIRLTAKFWSQAPAVACFCALSALAGDLLPLPPLFSASHKFQRRRRITLGLVAVGSKQAALASRQRIDAGRLSIRRRSKRAGRFRTWSFSVPTPDKDALADIDGLVVLNQPHPLVRRSNPVRFRTR